MLIAYGKKRARQGAGPVTLAIDFSYLKTLLTHATAIHGIIVDTECVRLARTALSHLGLIGRSTERERRPTEDEKSDIIAPRFVDTLLSKIRSKGECKCLEEYIIQKSLKEML